MALFAGSLPAHLNLEELLPNLLDGCVPVLKSYDPLIDRSKLTSRKKLWQDYVFLAEIVPEFQRYILLDIFLVPDELYYGIRSMLGTKTITTSVTFSTQIYVDIRYLLREEVGRGFTELQSISQSDHVDSQ
jgi:hypothetical protein